MRVQLCVLLFSFFLSAFGISNAVAQVSTMTATVRVESITITPEIYIKDNIIDVKYPDNVVLQFVKETDKEVGTVYTIRY